MKDNLQKFMFEHASVRGEFVELPHTWRAILSHQNYPAAVKKILGDLLAASALLSANLKFNGTMIMQIHGDGPVKLLVVECDANLNLRATAKLKPDVIIDDKASLAELMNQNGNGRFVITLDPNDKMPGQQAYQGIVPLDGDSIAVIIENYMMRSEQLDTKLWLATNDEVTRGLLLQKLPNHGGIELAIETTEEEQADAWTRAVLLGNTLKYEELVSTDIATLMTRLFWEETIRVFDLQHPQFHCSCTREKVGNMLKMLGQEEVNSAINELNNLAINCDFCGKHYSFDKIDCAQLFAVDTVIGGIETPSTSQH